MTAQSVLCQTWSETPKTGFLRMRLKSKNFKSDVEDLIKSYLELRIQDSRDENFEPRKPSIYVDTGVWLADVVYRMILVCSGLIIITKTIS